MKKKWGLLAVVCALVAALGLVGCSGSGEEAGDGEYTLMTEGVLVVGTSPDYPPFENLDEKTGEVVVESHAAWWAEYHNVDAFEIKVQVSAKGTTKYYSKEKTVTLKVKVK